MHLIVIEGRLRLITEVINQVGSLSTVKVVTGHRTNRATSGRPPGPGWIRLPGETRKWSRTLPVETELQVKTDEIIETEEWPVGIGDNPQVAEAVAGLVKPHVEAAVNSAIGREAARLRRVAPIVRPSAIEGACRTEGYPLPDYDEMEMICVMVHKDLFPPIKRRELPVKAPPVPPTPEPEATAQGNAIPPIGDDGGTPEPTVDPGEPSVPDGHFKSEKLGVLVDDDENRAKARAADHFGWPEAAFEAATLDEKGSAGFTLKFMASRYYDAEKHGTPFDHEE